MGECLPNCTSPPPPVSSPVWWSSLFSFLSTPTGIAIGLLVVGIVTALWLAVSSWYDSHALEIDVAETAGPGGYGVYSSRKKHRGKGR